MTTRLKAILLVSGLLSGGACSPDMSRQPRYNPLATSDFYADGRSARPALEGTVARGRLRTDDRYYRGRVGGALVGNVPIPVTRDVLERGRERYQIFCTPCHDRTGTGNGIVVQRGFRQPPSFHLDRLRDAPDGHFFDVMTNGFGAMASYASRVDVGDRWAITTYIRALQLSQSARLEDVPEAEREKLLGTER